MIRRKRGPTDQRDERLGALDQLFREVRNYRNSREYLELLRFTCRLPAYLPYNCFLIHMQHRGVSCVATPWQWRERFGRRIKDGARPLVILVPFGPVEFVYDINDTEGDPVPEKMLEPLKATGQVSNSVWRHTVQNCARDHVRVVALALHPGHGGYIGPAEEGDSVRVVVGRDAERRLIRERRKAWYRLRLNRGYDRTTRYMTVAHELAHLYCGHLGMPNKKKWWPNRRHLDKEVEEFEAQSVAYLVCRRLGIDTPSAAYLASYLRGHVEIPPISPEIVLKAAGRIEMMGRGRLKPRKEK